MSAAAGIVQRDGRAARASDADAMAAALSDRACDERRRWTCGPAALVWHAFHTTCESQAERQPVVDAAGRAIVFDGRLDNRDVLAEALDRGGPAGREEGDAALVLAAYDRWGEATPTHLLGEFAFAIWNDARRSLFCARDPIGVRPLYYVLEPARFLWATDHRALVASGVVAIAPNEAVVAEYLASEIQTRDETLYAGVHRLPAGHALAVTPESCRRWRYWDPAQTRDVRYANDAEYAERFLELFGESVACRLRSNRRSVGAHLSGGLDSSSVVGMVQALGRTRTVPPLETFSLAYAPGSAADESAFITEVERLWQLPAHRLAPAAPSGDAFRTHAARHRDVLDSPSDHGAATLRQAVRDAGLRVVLTGGGGDHGFAGSLFHYAELLRDGDFARAWRQLRADRGITDVGWSPFNVVAHGVLPLLPRRFKNAVRPLARRVGWPGGPPAWIAAPLAERVGLEARMRAAQPIDSSRASVCDAFDCAYNQWALEMVDRTDADFGIEERHPFFDRRLVEFAIGIPERQRWRGAETKFVIRRAMGELLPPGVARRTGKADFSAFAAAAIDALAAAGVYDNLQAAARGWVDPARVASMYREMKAWQAAGDERFTNHIFPLWMIGGVELWLDATFD